MPLTKTKIRNYWQITLRDQLSKSETSLTLCIIAIIFSMMASMVIILLRAMLIWLEELTNTRQVDLTGITHDWRVILPIIGAILIRISIALGSKKYKRMGIAYVIHKFNIDSGKLPFASVPAQFFQALFALACNFSVGREGPAIHLGAATASVLAQKCHLPDNSIKILCASGIAAGIAAVFNAPFAAVIFVFEVIIREYRTHYFIPIMLAAICGAVFSRFAFGNIHEFDGINAIHLPIEQYPLLLIMALILGVASAIFNSSLIKVTKLTQTTNLTLKLILAGVITSLIGFFLPQVLGSGDKAIELVVSSNPAISFLVVLLIAKVMVTIAAVGLGIPGGLIGPLYGIGAIIGTLVALIFYQISPEIAPFIGLYAVIGMTAMMGVCLSAPMAALVALLELTNNASIILPAMLVTTLAFFIAYKLCKSDSIFLRQLELMGLDYRVPIINKRLETIGVRIHMSQSFTLTSSESSFNTTTHDHPSSVIGLIKHKQAITANNGSQSFYSLCQGNTYTPLIGIADTASLNTAYAILLNQQQNPIYIYHNAPENIVGIITHNELEDIIHSKI